MKNVNLNHKPVRKKKLPLKVKTAISYDDLKKRAIEKLLHHGQSFFGLEEYVLLYADGKKHFFCLELLPLYLNLTSTKKN